MQAVPLGQLFAIPLQSAVRAQVLAAQETLSFVSEFGFQDGVARVFRFKAERTVEETVTDPQTGTTERRYVTRPFEVSVPWLALVPIPSMALSDLSAEFGIELVGLDSQTILAGGAEGTSLAGSPAVFTSLAETSPATMKVSMRLVQQVPEGAARLGDLLTELAGGSPGAPAVTTLRVQDVPGISAEPARALQERRIETVAQFLDATATAEGRRNLAATMGVSARRLATWIAEARLLQEEAGHPSASNRR